MLRRNSVSVIARNLIITATQFLRATNIYNWQNERASKDSERYDFKGLDSGCFSYLGDNAIGFSPSKFPELQGIQSLTLFFDERKLITKIGASYHSKKTDKKFTINELIDSLNLSQWTNWYIEAEKNSGFYINKMTRGTLLCNNLVIEPEVNYLPIDASTYLVWLDIESITNDETAYIRNAIAEARNKEEQKEQKKREEAENSNAAQRKSREEENRIREPFKP